jgi:hypothetical protein
LPIDLNFGAVRPFGDDFRHALAVAAARPRLSKPPAHPVSGPHRTIRPLLPERPVIHCRSQSKGAIMRPLSLLVSSLLVLPALHASAQSVAAPASEPSISTVQVSPPPGRVLVRSEEIDEVCGQYAMSNGWRLKVEPSWSGIDARIDRQRPIHLVAVSAEKYVSRDGNVVLQFDPKSDNGDMTMCYVPLDRTAGVVVLKATLAQR